MSSRCCETSGRYCLGKQQKNESLRFPARGKSQPIRYLGLFRLLCVSGAFSLAPKRILNLHLAYFSETLYSASPQTNKKALILLRIRAFSNFAFLRSGAYGTNGVFNLYWNSAYYKNLPRKAPSFAPASFLCFSDRNLPCSNGVKVGIFIWRTKIYKNKDWWIQLFSTIFLYLQ